MQRLNATTIAGGLFLLFWIALWIYGDSLPLSGRGGPIAYDPLFLPMALIWAGAALSLAILASGLLKPSGPRGDNQSNRKAGAAMLVIGAYFLLLKPLGFVISSVVMLLTLGLLLGFRRPLVLASVAAVGTAVVWVLFTQGLKAPLPTWPEGF